MFGRYTLLSTRPCPEPLTSSPAGRNVNPVGSESKIAAEIATMARAERIHSASSTSSNHCKLADEGEHIVLARASCVAWSAAFHVDGIGDAALDPTSGTDSFIYGGEDPSRPSGLRRRWRCRDCRGVGLQRAALNNDRDALSARRQAVVAVPRRNLRPLE